MSPLLLMYFERAIWGYPVTMHNSTWVIITTILSSQHLQQMLTQAVSCFAGLRSYLGEKHDFITFRLDLVKSAGPHCQLVRV